MGQKNARNGRQQSKAVKATIREIQPGDTNWHPTEDDYRVGLSGVGVPRSGRDVVGSAKAQRMKPGAGSGGDKVSGRRAKYGKRR